MKKLLLTSLIGIASMAAYAQKHDTVLFKKAQKIILKNNSTASENFKSAGKALIEKGYMIGSKDEQFDQLISEPIKVDFGHIIIYIITKDNEINISAKYRANAAVLVSFSVRENSYSQLTYTRKSDQYNAERFGKVLELLNTLDHTKVIYSE